jgi:hypothetical protein
MGDGSRAGGSANLRADCGVRRRNRAHARQQCVRPVLDEHQPDVRDSHVPDPHASGGRLFVRDARPDRADSAADRHPAHVLAASNEVVRYVLGSRGQERSRAPHPNNATGGLGEVGSRGHRGNRIAIKCAADHSYRGKYLSVNQTNGVVELSDALDDSGVFEVVALAAANGTSSYAFATFNQFAGRTDSSNARTLRAFEGSHTRRDTS